MVALSQRDLPYLVLTDDPVLEAYRTNRISDVKLECPSPEGGVICQRVSWAPFETLEPGDG